MAFARTRTWIEAVAASLMERFTSDLKKKIIDAFYHHYEWVDPHCLTCLRRLGQAPHDTTSALVLVTQHCHTREQQERAIAAVEFKGEVLWSFLDAIHYYSCTRDS